MSVSPLWFVSLLLAGDVFDVEASARRAADWLISNQREDGLFRYGWEPSLHRDLPSDHLIRQAASAYALARAASLWNDEQASARARDVLRVLLSKSLDGSSLSRRTSLKEGYHPVGMAALLLLTLVELPRPSDAERLQAKEWAAFLISCQRPDGSLRLSSFEDPIEDEERVDEEGWAYYPGEALFALAAYSRQSGESAGRSAVSRSRLVYTKLWRREREPAFIPWQSAAHAELAVQQRDQASAAFVFEMNDWLLGLQFTPDRYPEEWVGGFGHYHEGERLAIEPGITTASYAESLVEAVRTARAVGDARREAKYLAALESALRFVSRLQYRHEQLTHFEPSYRSRLVGAFFEGLSDGKVRIDFTQHAFLAMGGRLELDRLRRDGSRDKVSAARVEDAPSR